MDITGYALRSWSERAQRLFNLATYAHFKACEIEHEPARLIDDQIVMFPTPRAAWYERWANRLYAVFGALPDEETPPPSEYL